MTDDKPFLARWSQRKLAASRAAAAPREPTPVVPVTPAPVAESRPEPAAKPGADPAPELPPVESLTFDSDFTAFLSPKVDPQLRQQALRKLFRDPRFNVMDGLDVYIDDYTKFEPIPEDVIAQLAHAKYLFNPPKTRVNEQGHVEDVPDEPPPAREETVPVSAEASGTQPALPDVEASTGVAPMPIAPAEPTKS